MSPVVCVPDVNLVELGVRLPTGLVGMVIMQPFIELTEEPFHCRPERKACQIAALERTLEIAKIADHDAGKTHFTVIPEYSIPGPEGIVQVESILRHPSWPCGTVVIGGTDALCKAEYATLCGEERTAVDDSNTPTRVRNDEWINCCITWVKAANRDLYRWLQPKIAPARIEQNARHQCMFRGNSVYLFRSAFENGAPCRFFSLVCFDWIAAPNGQTILQQVLDSINTQGQGQVTPLSWVFVPQRNSEPCHISFLSQAANFFQNQPEAPLVPRENCCVVFANTAGGDKPGRATAYGYSSIIFSPRSPFDLKGCHLTYSGCPKVLRGSDALDQCRDVLFRERGACIHSFSHYLPGTVILGAAGHSPPLQQALVHPITPELNDPRTPGAPVPASVKWVNDSLDDVPCLSQQIPGVPLAGSIGIPHADNVAALRIIESSHLEKDINWATSRPLERDPSPEDKPPTADEWSADQRTALEHMVHALDILRIGGSQLDFTTHFAHATASLRAHSVEVLAVNGPSHEACVTHVKHHFKPPPRHQVLLVTRNPQCTRLLPKEKSFLQVGAGARLGEETKFTDVNSGWIHVGFGDLIDAYMGAASTVDLEDSLYVRLT